MNIVTNLTKASPPPNGAVVTIGNFDGVHLGHRAIFRRLITRARELDGQSTVITFVPHPLKLLAPEKAPRLLNTYSEKQRLIEASCVDVLIELPFTRVLAAMTPQQFIDEILLAHIGMRHLIVGYDYTFGRNRAGNAAFLVEAGRRQGFAVEVIGPVLRGEVASSSTLVRRMLYAGDVVGVVGLLGRHFNLEGRVVHGVGRGRQIGIPTANLLTEKEVLPRPGVYAVRVKRGAELFDGVMNIGFNPTFGLERISLEVHLLDFQGDLYGETLRVYFVERLRDEQIFASLEALTTAIHADIVRARQILSVARIIEYHEYLGQEPPVADTDQNG
jgi:riboflavin kinase/FMN adenylyltransferase